ncbi:hypothetical protein BOTBODRAFT_69072 [Botryobasidium botryosum FD-172 SS1]|uniref:Uncharacterized protein n=1 Tax=Botryobasidium botryosum (strain FD-172 SS1) TaxID=930990 RepID=A0A067MD52_BOTB1|nr:hypothetical protein BOTBODRAFT_69072 [Botryobasidium botryosum FD-172 SS1]
MFSVVDQSFNGLGANGLPSATTNLSALSNNRAPLDLSQVMVSCDDFPPALVHALAQVQRLTQDPQSQLYGTTFSPVMMSSAPIQSALTLLPAPGTVAKPSAAPLPPVSLPQEKTLATPAAPRDVTPTSDDLDHSAFYDLLFGNDAEDAQSTASDEDLASLFGESRESSPEPVSAPAASGFSLALPSQPTRLALPAVAAPKPTPVALPPTPKPTVPNTPAARPAKRSAVPAPAKSVKKAAGSNVESAIYIDSDSEDEVPLRLIVQRTPRVHARSARPHSVSSSAAYPTPSPSSRKGSASSRSPMLLTTPLASPQSKSRDLQQSRKRRREDDAVVAQVSAQPARKVVRRATGASTLPSPPITPTKRFAMPPVDEVEEDMSMYTSFHVQSSRRG